MNKINSKYIVQNKNDFNYTDYRNIFNSFNKSFKSYYEIAPLIEEKLISAKKVYLWGMSFTSLSDIYKTLNLLSAREMSPEIYMMISHNSSIGNIWIEPLHSDNGIERRARIISNTIEDFNNIKANIHTYNIDDIPISNGFIIDNDILFMRCYNYTVNSQSNEIYPLELISSSEYERKNYYSEDKEEIKDILDSSFMKVYNKSHSPSDIRTFFSDIK